MIELKIVNKKDQFYIVEFFALKELEYGNEIESNKDKTILVNQTAQMIADKPTLYFSTQPEVKLFVKYYEASEIAKVLGGACHWYGLKYRPFSIGAQPKGQSAFIENEVATCVFSNIKHAASVRHGAIAYPNKLETSACESYELVPLDITTNGEYVDKLNAVDIDDYIILEQLSQSVLNTHNKGNKFSTEELVELFSLMEKSNHFLDRHYRNLESFNLRKEFPAQFEELCSIREYITLEIFSDYLKMNHLI